MIYAKTVCKNPGSFVSVVPVGLLAKLQYNANGLLQTIFYYYKDNEEPKECSREQFAELAQFCPNKIALTGGTTWVEGVFFFEDVPKDEGRLPYCLVDFYFNALKRNYNKVKFYAGTVSSLAASFTGANTIRTWLGMNKFEVLPGAVVPIEFTEDTIHNMLSTGAYKFPYPLFSGYYVFSGLECEYVEAGLSQAKIQKMETGLSKDGDGCIKSTLQTDSGEFIFNYSTVCFENLAKGDTFVYYIGEYIEIVCVRDKIKLPVQKPVEYTCPICYKKFLVPKSGIVQCDDPHCMSHKYPDVKHMLECLNLPVIPYERYIESVKNREVITETDVLLLPEYKEEVIKCTLSQALRASVPVSACLDNTLFDKLVAASSGEVDTVLYYIKNPYKMITELSVDSISAKKLIQWCADEYNQLTVSSLLSAVHVEAPAFQFEGAPIFRGNSFVLTGKFKRGNYEKIASIIKSYAGEVLASISDKRPSVVITGGTDEEISGKIIQQAKALNIPIMTEDHFFISYEIDRDLAAYNLL